MAQVQRPPSFPTSNFLGRPEHRSHPGPALPPIQASGATAPHHLEGRTLPPIQLPPVHAPYGAVAPPGQTLGKVSSISQLLSQTSPPQTRAQPARLQQPAYYAAPNDYGAMHGVYRAPEQPTHYPPPSSYGSHPHDHRPQQPYAQPTAHRFEQPNPERQVQETYRAETFSHVRLPNTLEKDRPLYSPAVTSHSSSTTYYDSEPSPRASMTPGSVPTEHPRVSQPLPFIYKLVIRQQPAAARACGFGERDRRVIDPPPILELKITDRETGRPESDWSAMLALHCTLLSPDGRDDETEVPPSHPEMLSTRRLMGTLVASPYPAKDENGVAGTFFVFPDLSCRSPGNYRLRFKLMRIDPTMMLPGMSSPSVATVTTDVFSVFTAKDFPGMRASSALLKSLRRQGLNVGVKKGSEARKGKGRAKKESSSSEEEDADDSDGSQERRRGSGETGGAKSSAGGVSPKTKTTKQKAKRKRRES